MHLKNVEDEHTQAVERLKSAQEKLSKATDESSKALAQEAVRLAEAEVDETARKQNEAEEAKSRAQQDLKENTEKAAQGLDNFTNAVSEIASGSLYGFANGIVKLVSSFKGVSDGLSEVGGKVGGIIGAILQIIDALGDDPAQFIKDLLDKIANVIEKVLEDLPQIIVNALEGVGNIVAGADQLTQSSPFSNDLGIGLNVSHRWNVAGQLAQIGNAAHLFVTTLSILSVAVSLFLFFFL